MKITVFKDVYDTDAKQDELVNILEIIKDGTFKNEVETIRLLNQSTKTKDKKKAQAIKRGLPMFRPASAMRARKEMNDADVVTGIVHFDIDLTDNQGIDVVDVLKAIIAFPSTIYAFLSPSGGVKFGIITDFDRRKDENIEVTRSRYPEAYARTKAIMLPVIDVVFDDNMKSIKSTCHVSYDPDLYYNPNARKLALGTIDAMPDHEVTEPTGSVDEKYILELLNYVDPYLPYTEMRAVAYCVFHYLGNAGFDHLFHHFADKDGELKRKLTDLMKGTQRGYLSALESQARKGGWKPKTGKGRKAETNQPSNHRFSKPMSANEAVAKITEIVNDCVTNKKSHQICVTCGVGKSEINLLMMRALPPNVKVQYHSSSGALQDELYRRYNDLPDPEISFFEAKQQNPKVKNIKGMAWENEKGETLCIEAALVNKLREIRAGLPATKCYFCPKISSCGYINQFGQDDQIRFTSTAQYFGETSKWDNGIEFGPSGERPRAGNFIPDLIIVDEDCVQVETYDAGANAYYQSLSMLVAECQTGVDLITAIQKHEIIIIDDYEEAKQVAQQHKKSILAGETPKGKKFDVKEFQILERLASYIRTSNDDVFLDGLRFFPRKDVGNFKRDATIELNVVKKPNKLYEGIPTIYLNATADEEVMKRVFPRVPFTKLHVKQSDNIQVYQLEGANVTKQWLANKKNIEKLAARIQGITSEFADGLPKIGLITYQAIRDDAEFFRTLGKKIGASVIGYFGNVSGRNDFADVDFLFVVGRYSSNDIHHERMSQALFKHDWVGEKGYVDQPIHMADGTCRSLNSHLHMDQVDQIIYRHFSVAQTIQAIGRARLIHGKPKSVYLFSNESLGEDVQISDFFQMAPETFDTQIAAIAVREYIDLGKVQVRQDVGISDHMWREKRDILIDRASDAGIKYAELSGVDAHRHNFTKQFLVADHAAFQAFANSANGTFTYLN